MDIFDILNDLLTGACGTSDIRDLLKDSLSLDFFSGTLFCLCKIFFFTFGLSLTKTFCLNFSSISCILLLACGNLESSIPVLSADSSSICDKS